MCDGTSACVVCMHICLFVRGTRSCFRCAFFVVALLFVWLRHLGAVMMSLKFGCQPHRRVHVEMRFRHCKSVL